MHPLTRHIRACHNANPAEFTPLFIGGQPLGCVHARIIDALSETTLLRREAGQLHLASSANNLQAHSAALQKVLHHLIGKGLVPHERFELYNVAPWFGEPAVALADRALMPALGLPAHGIHCNAYVWDGHAIKLWIARRSPSLLIEPNKLDHLVAGGQPYDLSLRENLAKEAWEEAAIPRELVAAAQSVGALRYARQEGYNIRRDTLFVFDLELPASFTPQSNDGESGQYQLVSLDWVMEKMVATDEFKFNVPLVIIDFLIRHGAIDADAPGYAELALTRSRLEAISGTLGAVAAAA